MRYVRMLALAFVFAAVSAWNAPAAEGEKAPEKAPAGQEDKAKKELIEKQSATYPLKTCVVSGEDLASMGGVINHVYKDRLVKLCCKSCVRKFEKEPEKYLAMIDEAVKKAEKPAEK